MNKNEILVFLNENNTTTNNTTNNNTNDNVNNTNNKNNKKFILGEIKVKVASQLSLDKKKIQKIKILFFTCCILLVLISPFLNLYSSSNLQLANKYKNKQTKFSIKIKEGMNTIEKQMIDLKRNIIKLKNEI